MGERTSGSGADLRGVATGVSGVITRITCLQCGSGLELVARGPGLREYVCPSHGAVGLYCEAEDLDLGLRRASDA